MTQGAVDPARLTAFQRSLELERLYAKGHPPPPVDPPPSGTVRILSWNIARGQDPARLGDTLCALRPDIACLQEVDWGNRRTGGADVLQVLAARTGMGGLFGIEFLEVDAPGRLPRLAGGGVTGNALLTRVAPSAAFRVDLPPCLDWQADVGNPQLPRFVHRRLRREPRIGRRFGIGAELAIGGRNLVVCCLHLEDKFGGMSGRWAQYAAAREAIRPRLGPGAIGVIAGDFNTFDSPLARLFSHESDASALGKPPFVKEAAWWQSTLLPPTGYADPFPANAATFRLGPFFKAKLDWIATNDGVVRDCGIGAAGPSDHRPIWVDLDLQGNRPGVGARPTG